MELRRERPLGYPDGRGGAIVTRSIVLLVLGMSVSIVSYVAGSRLEPLQSWWLIAMVTNGILLAVIAVVP